MKHTFMTSVGTVEVVVHEEERVFSVYRLNEDHRPVVATTDSWDYADLADVLTRRAGVPAAEATEIAAGVLAEHRSLRLVPEPIAPAATYHSRPEAHRGPQDYAGVAIRFVALLLDLIIVFFPLSIVVGLMTGGGYREGQGGTFRAGVEVADGGLLVFTVLGFGYYVLAEGLTGATVGKRIVGIRVESEDGEFVGLGPALVRNLLRFVDGLFFYLVGAIFAFTSPRAQRLGDRAAHTVVVRRWSRYPRT
jgi:uncharacterized RDD family membrane protein YckC